MTTSQQINPNAHLTNEPIPTGNPMSQRGGALRGGNQHLINIWRTLTHPSPRVKGTDVRRLTRLLLAYQALTILMALLWLAFVLPFVDAPPTLLLALVIIGVQTAAYFITRTGAYRIGALLSAGVMSLGVWLLLIAEPESPSLGALIGTSPAIVGLFFSLRRSVIVLLINTVLILTLPWIGAHAAVSVINTAFVQALIAACTLAILHYSKATRSDYTSELTEGQAKLRLITAQLPSILWTTDMNLRVNYLVGSHHNVSGQPFSIQQGKTIYDVVALPDDVQLAAHQFALSGSNAQYEVMDKGRHYSVRVEPLHDTNRAIIGCIALANDITARKETEDQLRFSEQRYRSLFEATFEAIILYDQGKIVDVNHAFEIMCGYTREQAASLSLMQLFAPRSMDEVIKQLSLGSQAPFEISAQRHDGSTFWAELQMKETRYHDKLVRVLALRDITVQKKAEQDLRTSETLFRQMAESIREIFFVRDVESGDLIYISPAYDEIWGRPRAKLAQQPDDFWNAIHPEDLPEIQEVLSGHLQKPASVEYRIIWADGSVRWIVSRVFPVMDAYGQVYRVTGISEDVTESKHLQMERLEAERLRLEIEKERDFLDLKERFITMVSHEFRTPLTVIVSSSDLLDKYFERLTPERRQEHLRKIKAQSLVLTDMMNDVLTFAKAQAGKLSFDPAPLDLRAFCENLYDQFHLSDKHQHELRMTLDCSAGELPLDQKLLQHILVNLLSNAIKYSPDGAPVQFDVRCKPEGVMFIVRDRGIGIPEQDLDRLFEPFHRASNISNIEGTGLGLAIVKNAVEAHGGTILCESAVGLGTTFTVEIPLAQTAQRAS